MDQSDRSVSRVTTVLANVSSVFQLFSFLVVCSGMISTGWFIIFLGIFVTLSPEQSTLMYPDKHKVQAYCVVNTDVISRNIIN